MLPISLSCARSSAGSPLLRSANGCVGPEASSVSDPLSLLLLPLSESDLPEGDGKFYMKTWIGLQKADVMY